MSKMRVTFNLAGCRALVTGSASGIGRASAELLARSGAHVAMNDLAADALDATLGQMPARRSRARRFHRRISMR